MRPKLKITGPGTHQQVRDAFRKENDPKRSRKLQAIRMGFMGEYTTEQIARIWDQVAVAYANRVYETLDEIEEDITAALRPFWESPKPVLSLLGAENYLLVSANAS